MTSTRKCSAATRIGAALRLNQLDIPNYRHRSRLHPISPRLFEATYPKLQRIETSLSCVFSELIDCSAVSPTLWGQFIHRKRADETNLFGSSYRDSESLPRFTGNGPICFGRGQFVEATGDS
jgi:hypothetical protein